MWLRHSSGNSKLQDFQSAIPRLSNNDKDQPKNIVTPVTPDINSLSIVLEAVEGPQGSTQQGDSCNKSLGPGVSR